MLGILLRCGKEAWMSTLNGAGPVTNLPQHISLNKIDEAFYCNLAYGTELKTLKDYFRIIAILVVVVWW